MTEALVTPQLIRWARERYSLTKDAAAQKIDVKVDTLDAWEKGTAYPTLRQAQKLAHRFHVPFGFLFLSSPPIEKLPLPDLRTVGGAQHKPPSPDFIDLLNDVLRKQQWFREYQEYEGAEPIPFIGRFTLNDNAETIATDVRNVLNINEDMRQRAASWEDFLREFIRRTEQSGVLVLRSGVVENNSHRKLSVEEFRGFDISDNLAPLVFINGNDAKAAQIFTLAHELAHLWIGESGISNPDYRQRSSQQSNHIERLCNYTAAEILLPKEEFLARWGENAKIATNLQTLATEYRVSRLVVLRQAYECGKVTSSEYWEYYQKEIAQQKSKSKEGGGNFYATLLARNSTTLTTSLISAMSEGRISYRDTARLLNIKVKTLNGVVERLSRR